MKSKESLRLPDLNQDLPTTRGDVISLRNIRQDPNVDIHAYLEFLGSLPVSPVHSLRSKKGPTGSKVFTL